VPVDLVSRVDVRGVVSDRRAMRITYYVEILSSWCHWVEPVWNELKIRYAGRVEFEWKIALMNPGDFPASQAQAAR
jgi:predicted DsbA family dithiol-disulfide isomerase